MKFSLQTGIDLALVAGLVLLATVEFGEYQNESDALALSCGLLATLLLSILAVGSYLRRRQWRRMEKRLRNSEKLAAQTQRIAQLGTCTWDFAAKTSIWSQGLYDIHGIAPDTAISLENYLAWVHPDDRERARWQFVDALKSGKSECILEYRIRRPDGVERNLYLKARFQRAARGRAVSGEGLIQDITERTHDDEELVHMQRQLETAMRASRLSMWEIDFTNQTYSSKGWIHFLSHAGEFTNPLDQLKARAHPEDWPGLQQAFAGVIVGKSSDIALQLRISNPDGEWRWMHTQGSVTRRDADGRALRITGTHSDITERKQQQDEILRANERLDLALQGSRLAIWDAHVATGRVYLSQGWAEILGGAPRETFTDVSALIELAHPDDREIIFKASNAALKGTVPEYRVEHRVLTQSGAWKWILSHGRVTQRDASGHAVRVTGTNADISARKEIERMKDEFITVVSHELRTPLTSIVGSLALLDRVANVNADTQTLIRIARDNSHRLVRLINDILDVEKLASTTMPLRVEPVELEALLRSAIEANQAFANQFGVNFSLVHCEGPTWVNGNFDKLMQVMANLLSNAAKFSPRGANVDVRLERIRDSARVSVVDRGTGIPEDFKPRIFDRFAQADSSNSRQRGGTGLGLAICKIILDRLEGQIGFISTPDTGTTFFFDLEIQAQAALHNAERRRAVRAP